MKLIEKALTIALVIAFLISSSPIIFLAPDRTTEPGKVNISPDVVDVDHYKLLWMCKLHCFVLKTIISYRHYGNCQKENFHGVAK